MRNIILLSYAICTNMYMRCYNNYVCMHALHFYASVSVNMHTQVVCNQLFVMCYSCLLFHSILTKVQSECV